MFNPFAAHYHQEPSYRKVTPAIITQPFILPPLNKPRTPEVERIIKEKQDIYFEKQDLEVNNANLRQQVKNLEKELCLEQLENKSLRKKLRMLEEEFIELLADRKHK